MSVFDRRSFLRMSTAAALLPIPALSACTTDDDMSAYTLAASRPRAPLPASPDIGELVRFATLAANGHNTQPWRFVLHQSGVSILPDLSRRTPAVDPDDHHLIVSLGCAAENFLIAGAATGRPGTATFDAIGYGRVDIDLTNGAAKPGPLFDAIPARQSTRSEYDGHAVPMDHLKQLESAAAIEGVSIMLLPSATAREAVLDFVIEGNSTQIDDPAFVTELRDWVRFNPSEAIERGDGLFSAAGGNPTVPTWLGRLAFRRFFTKAGENDKYTKHLRSSAGVAVFVGDKEDRDHWVRVGRSFQRFALQATALGIRTAHINQPVEVPAIRSRFAKWLGIGGARPDLVVRFGYAPLLPMSMRRPVDQVIAA